MCDGDDTDIDAPELQVGRDSMVSTASEQRWLSGSVQTAAADWKWWCGSVSQYHQYDTKVYDGDGADIDAPKLEGGRDSMVSTVDS